MAGTSAAMQTCRKTMKQIEGSIRGAIGNRFEYTTPSSMPEIYAKWKKNGTVPAELLKPAAKSSKTSSKDAAALADAITAATYPDTGRDKKQTFAEIMDESQNRLNNYFRNNPWTGRPWTKKDLEPRTFELDRARYKDIIPPEFLDMLNKDYEAGVEYATKVYNIDRLSEFHTRFVTDMYEYFRPKMDKSIAEYDALLPEIERCQKEQDNFPNATIEEILELHPDLKAEITNEINNDNWLTGEEDIPEEEHPEGHDAHGNDAHGKAPEKSHH